MSTRELNNAEKDLMQKLKEHPQLDTTHIHVVVEDGIAILKGKADTEEEKKWAEEIASTCPGISEVKNELHVGTGIIHAITQIVSGLSASNDEDLHKDK